MPLTPVSSRSVVGVPVRALLAVLIALGSALVVPAGPASADAIRGQQWQLGFLRAQEAWRHSTGLGVTVAVIDSGVDANHPDLRGQVLPGADFVDASTDGRKDVVGHGTTVAALIAGKGDGDGVIGLAYGAKILPIRVLDPQNKYDSADVVAKAIRWAVDRGARVINLSLGSADVAPVLSDALKYAFDHDVVVVACDGNVSNNRGTTVWHPAREPGVIAVSGVVRSGKFWTGSLQGPATVLAAPGADITGAHPGGTYWNVQGTSFASPLVAAAAALVLARFPQMSSADAVNRLIQTAWDFGPKGRDAQFGFGIVNPTRALTASIPPVRSNPLLPNTAPPAAGGQAEKFDPPKWPGDPTGVAKPQPIEVGEDDPFVPQSLFALLALACVGLIMLAVAGVVVVLLLSIRRGRRIGVPGSAPPTLYQPPPQPPPPGGHDPTGYPPAAAPAPPGGYRATAAMPPPVPSSPVPAAPPVSAGPPVSAAPPVSAGPPPTAGYPAMAAQPPAVRPPAMQQPSVTQPPVAQQPPAAPLGMEPPAVPPSVEAPAVPPAVPPSVEAPAVPPTVRPPAMPVAQSPPVPPLVAAEPPVIAAPGNVQPDDSPVTPAAPTRRLGPWPPVWRRRPPQ